MIDNEIYLLLKHHEPEAATEKWCKRGRLQGQDKTIGVYLQKSKYPLKFKSSQKPNTDSRTRSKEKPTEEVII